MSKYIDIVGIVRENDEFSLTIDIEEKLPKWERGDGEPFKSTTTYNCKVYRNGIGMVDKYNNLSIFHFFDYGREELAKLFMRFLDIYHITNKYWYEIKVTVNDYSFLLDKRGWRK